MVGSAEDKPYGNQDDALAKTMETIALLTARHRGRSSGDAHELASPRRASAAELSGARPGEDARRAYHDAPGRAQEAAPRYHHLGSVHETTPRKESPPRGVPTIDMSRLKADREDLARQLCKYYNVTPKDSAATPPGQPALNLPGGAHELAGVDPRRLV